MPDHARWMHRCLELARLGAGGAAPNPMVGAVLVLHDRLLAKGWHKKAGGPHAEVECLRAFGDGEIPDQAVLYVNLEPCAHHGKTPPCADLLIERGVKHVVIAHRDPFPEVSGKGIERLRGTGIEVTEGILEDEAKWMNRRFLTAMEKGRPYILLKWAQSADGFMDQHPRGAREVQRISSPVTDVLAHRWRTEEQAILVGSRTVLNDDPRLDVRHVEGRAPLRVVLDRDGRVPSHSKVFEGPSRTLLFTRAQRSDVRAEQFIVESTDDPIDRILAELQQRSVRSVLVEGGAELLLHFISRSLWDEARVITGAPHFESGTTAPTLPLSPLRTHVSHGDHIALYLNEEHIQAPIAEWPW